MQRLCSTLTLGLTIAFVATINAEDAQPNKPTPPGLGDPGKLVELTVETGRDVDGVFEVAGRDASQQLLITGVYDSGQTRDLSGKAEYTVSPEGIATVDKTGHVTPIAEGDAVIHVRVGDVDATTKVKVSHIIQDLPVNFPNQIVPAFTKYGCNGGGCHGKSGGQNGFRLSLLGFEPTEDYEYLVKEARGRRLFLAAPERSLLLEKGAAVVPHGGGMRIPVDSPAYRLLVRWIEQGVPYGNADDPVVTGIEVHPQERLMERNGTQQIVVIARYSDGHTEDVTRMTQFDSNDTEMAEPSVTGLVTTSDLTGSVAIMARYQGHVGVFRATVPLGIEVKDLPPTRNYIDEKVFAKLQSLGLPASAVADDATFLRRVTVDIAGRLPTREESEAFLADGDSDKRAKVIDKLLDSMDYAEYFANKWNAILRNKRGATGDRQATFHFHDWIRTSLHENKPYDQFVREVISASGMPGVNPPTAWYREVKDEAAQVEDTAQLFLGLRIQCARCHHHPFEKWSQQDYYGFQAFYSRVGRKKSNVPNYDRIYHQRGVAQSKNPKTGEMVKPTGLGSNPLELTPDQDPRQSLADWMGDKSNPFFAKAFVNRYWKHFFGRGLVDPEDDMRVTNPACNPELLDALAEDFLAHDFDMKHMIRTICNSSTYQLSSDPNEWNQDDKQNFSRYYPKRLNAEVLLDAIDQVTATTTSFSGLPSGTRAVELPDNGFNSYFLTVFGRPESASACECERSSEANLAQSLHLLNSSEIQGKLTAGNGRAAALTGAKDVGQEAKVRELFLTAFSREPSSQETEIAVKYVQKAENEKVAFEDMIWAVINTKEFLFNH
ncbi:MAG: DUF1553 domain-containing protein [Planctomycetales bacterium]|nr:DUF1553 domain-containing protein [Planctomycetales bacterium]